MSAGIPPWQNQRRHRQQAPPEPLGFVLGLSATTIVTSISLKRNTDVQIEASERNYLIKAC